MTADEKDAAKICAEGATSRFVTEEAFASLYSDKQ